MNKRGVSSVIATILTILIVVVSVTVIWISTMPLLRDKDFGTNLDSSAEIVVSKGYTAWDEDKNELSVQIKLGRKGDKVPTGIDFLFYIEGNTIKERVNEIPTEHGTRVYYFTLPKKPDKIKIALVYGGKAGSIESEVGDIPEFISSEILDMEFITIGSVFSSLSRFLVVNEDLIPGMIPISFGNKVYSIKLTSGSEVGKIYFIETANEYDSNGTIFDYFYLNERVQLSVGDEFEIYSSNSFCGDTFCNNASEEDCSTCSEDCKKCFGGSCNSPEECFGGYCVHNICRNTPAYYGDGFCDLPEVCDIYVDDCGLCVDGDGICSPGETCYGSPSDCGACVGPWDFCELGPSTCLNVWSFSDVHFDDETPAYHNYNWSEIFDLRLDSMSGNYDKFIVAGDMIPDGSDIDEITFFDNIIEGKGLKDKLLYITGNHEHAYEDFVINYYLENISTTNSFNFTHQEGNILFIMLGDEPQISYNTYQWFNKTVAENQDKIIIMVTHRNPNLLSRLSEIESTFDNYNVDIWIYGHTHAFDVYSAIFNSGKIWYLNDGNWECSRRQCPFRTLNASQKSILLTFNNNSNKVNLTKVIYDPVVSDTIPYFEDLGEIDLSKNFMKA